MKQNNQRTILFSKYDYTKPYYPNDLTGKEILLYNYILGLKKGFEELHHCKMTYMYLPYSHFNSIHKMDWRTYDKAFHGLVRKLYLVQEDDGEYTFFPAKFNDYPSDVDIAKAFIMKILGILMKIVHEIRLMVDLGIAEIRKNLKTHGNWLVMNQNQISGRKFQKNIKIQIKRIYVQNRVFHMMKIFLFKN